MIYIYPLHTENQFVFPTFVKSQVIGFRKSVGAKVRFILMNSFSTSTDTLSYLSKYPVLSADPNLELMQNKVPKVDAQTFAPAEWPINRNQEWCPPGHGDLYAALDGSGILDKVCTSGSNRYSTCYLYLSTCSRKPV